MTATLEEIHRDPEIIDRAISRSERLDIVSDGVVTATVTPAKSDGLSPDELGLLANKLANAADVEKAAAIREEMTRGFYGDPSA